MIGRDRGPLTLAQMQNIVHLIVEIGVAAERRGEITPQEKDAIISFTSTATALRKTFDEFKLDQLNV
jgi:hypothetical protein